MHFPLEGIALPVKFVYLNNNSFVVYKIMIINKKLSKIGKYFNMTAECQIQIRDFVLAYLLILLHPLKQC